MGEINRKHKFMSKADKYISQGTDGELGHLSLLLFNIVLEMKSKCSKKKKWML